MTQERLMSRADNLELLKRERLIGTCRADQFRQDLKDAGLGDWQCALTLSCRLFCPKSELIHRRAHSWNRFFLRSATNYGLSVSSIRAYGDACAGFYCGGISIINRPNAMLLQAGA